MRRFRLRGLFLGVLAVFVLVLASGGLSLANAAEDAASSSSGSSDAAASSDSSASSGGDEGASGSDSGSGDKAAGDGEKGLVDKAVEKAKKVYEAVKNGISGAIGAITGLGGSESGGTDAAASGTDAAGDGSASGSGDPMMCTIKDGIDNLKEYTTDDGENLDKFKNLVDDMKNGNVGGEDIGQSIDLIEKMKAEGKEKLLHPYMSKISDTAVDADKLMKSMPGDDTAKLIGSGPADGSATAADGSKNLSDLYGSDLSNKITPLMTQNPNVAGSGLEKITSSAADGNTSSDGSTTSLGGVKFDGGSFDYQGYSGNEISKKDALLRVDATYGPTASYENKFTSADGKGQLQVEGTAVAGGRFEAEGKLKVMQNGALIDGKASVYGAVGLSGDIKADGSYKLSEDFAARGTGTASFIVGADGEAKGNIYVGKNGVEMKGSAEARFGAWADAQGTASMQYKGESLVSVQGEAGAGVGLGAGVKGGYAFRTDKVGFNASITLGPVKLGGGIYVNPVAITQLAIDKGGQAVRAVGDAAVKTGQYISNTASNIGNGAKKVWNSIFG